MTSWLDMVVTGLLITGLLLAILFLAGCTGTPAGFSGDRAYQHVTAQMAFGPRPPGSDALVRTAAYIRETLQANGWAVSEQAFEHRGVTLRNLLAQRGQGPATLLIAHYDTRRRADRDRNRPNDPVPGANDGASGVAVLLELSRVLQPANRTVVLAFVDGEDQGQLDGWDWIVGSRYLAANLPLRPEAVVVVDMVGDQEQRFPYEATSTPALREQLWALAKRLGYGAIFVPQVGIPLIDDHTPFLQAGIPAVDIIDFDYPYWHTTGDTADKVSPASLERVGKVLAAWLQD